jgi:ADP-dependent phosphofructokinase/glucokinase
MRIASIVLGTISLSVSLLAGDFTGTWSLNIAQSKTERTVTSQTNKIEKISNQTFRTTIDAVTKSGEKTHQEIIRTFDGKEHPAEGTGFSKENSPSEICEQVDASTRKITQKRNGKTTSVLNVTISPDGKTMTTIRTGNRAETLVFDKQ